MEGSYSQEIPESGCFIAELWRTPIGLSLSQGDRSVDVMVLVQKDAPRDLLLGTDTQSHLGFSLLMMKLKGEVVDLLSGRVELPRLPQEEKDSTLSSAPMEAFTTMSTVPKNQLRLGSVGRHIHKRAKSDCCRLSESLLVIRSS
jgi:hypothetical protein